MTQVINDDTVAKYLEEKGLLTPLLKAALVEKRAEHRMPWSLFEMAVGERFEFSSEKPLIVGDTIDFAMKYDPRIKESKLTIAKAKVIKVIRPNYFLAERI
jgi:hypothetical protein